MANRRVEGVLQGLSQLAAARAAEQTDGELLERFAAHRDEAAFAALLQRHGGLVYRVCRTILHHEQEAEDAFQGTFLVLARRAAAVRDGKALSGWLYRVAYRVAKRTRRAAARRRAQELQTAKPIVDSPACEISWRELQAILDEELDRLPEKHRLPFVLCCLTGLSKSEAAAELGWSEGTVSSRLAHARQLLRSRLARRGVSLSAVLSGLAVAANGAAAAIPSALVAVTVREATAFAAGETMAATVPVLLARSALRGMTLARAKLPAVLLAVLGVLGSAAAVLHEPPEPPNPAAAPPPPREAAAVPPRPAGGPDPPAPGRTMTVTGSVTGPEGRAVPGARIAVMADPRFRPGDHWPLVPGTQILGEGQADDRGRFRLSVPQTTHGHNRLSVLAFAPGFAPSTQTAEPLTITAPEHELPLRLVRGHTVRGRLVDPAGRPAANVRVLVLGMERPGPPFVSIVYHDPPVPLPGWPEQVITDAGGNFAIPDVGSDTKLLLQVRDERFATEWLDLRAGKAERAEATVINLSPPRVMEGRVIAADTGLPLADAIVAVETMLPVEVPSYGAFPGIVRAKTDADGRYRVRPFPGERLEAWVYPAAGQPYLVLRQELGWPKGNAAKLADFNAPRGILVRGRVEEAGSGRPVPGAGVTFHWGYRDNPLRDRDRRRGVEWRTRDVATAPDGTFLMTVPPGRGMLFVKAAEHDFVHVEVGSEEVEGGRGGTPYFPDAFAPMTLKPAEPPQDLTFRLRRGVTVRGRVVGANGQLVVSAVLFTPSYVPLGLESKGQALLVRDGRFELPGCDPGKPVRVWVYDADGKQGTMAEFKADEKSEPEVRLLPCSSARFRVTNAGGKPVGGTHVSLELILRPGGDVNTSMRNGTTAGISLWASSVYGRFYRPAETGVGNFTLPNLIPGATYAVRAEGAGGYSERMTFTAPISGSRDVGILGIAPRE